MMRPVERTVSPSLTALGSPIIAAPTVSSLQVEGQSHNAIGKLQDLIVFGPLEPLDTSNAVADLYNRPNIHQAQLGAELFYLSLYDRNYVLAAGSHSAFTSRLSVGPLFKPRLPVVAFRALPAWCGRFRLSGLSPTLMTSPPKMEGSTEVSSTTSLLISPVRNRTTRSRSASSNGTAEAYFHLLPAPMLVEQALVPRFDVVNKADDTSRDEDGEQIMYQRVYTLQDLASGP